MLQTFNILRCELSKNSILYENIQALQDAINEDNVNNLALATTPFKTKIILFNGFSITTSEPKDKESES